jgi:hypothetical protein
MKTGLIVVWSLGHLGSVNKQIPNCVVWRIRETQEINSGSPFPGTKCLFMDVAQTSHGNILLQTLGRLIVWPIDPEKLHVGLMRSSTAISPRDNHIHNILHYKAPRVNRNSIDIAAVIQRRALPSSSFSAILTLTWPTYPRL